MYFQWAWVDFYSSSLRSSGKNRSILACLINIHESLFWLACCFLSDARLGQPQGKLEAAHSNQRRFGYIRSLKYHLVVMLGARIDVIQPQIRNLIAYLLPLPDKKPTTAVVKRDKTSGLDRNDRQKCSHLQRTLLIRKGSIKYCLLLMLARLKISCISRLSCMK